MGEAKHRFKHRHERMARGAAGRFVALELNLREFEIPVAVFVPDKGVDGVGGYVETIVGISRRTSRTVFSSSLMIQRSTKENVIGLPAVAPMPQS